jgi:DNA-directed RNA polymerase subunit RPC12/RpoP
MIKLIKKLFKIYRCIYCWKKTYRIMLRELDLIDFDNYFICKKCLPLAREE